MNEEHLERYRRIGECDDPDLKLVTGTPADRLSGLKPLLRYAKGRSVLDIGCHIGTVSEAFASRGARSIDGVDLFRPGVEQARKRLQDYPTESHFEVCDLSGGPDALKRALPRLQETYDIVLYLGMHHHLSRQMPADELKEFVCFLVSKATQFLAVRTSKKHIDLVHRLLIDAGMVQWRGSPRRNKIGQLRIYRNPTYEVPPERLLARLASLFS